MISLKGVFPPVITLFNSKGEVDIAANKKMADYLIESGVAGITYLGTTGEFGSLTLEEKKLFIKEISEYIAGRVKVLVGIGDTCLANTLELLSYLSNLPVDAVLLVNTYFSVYSKEAVINYFQTVDQQSELPIIIYNFPSLTGFNFTKYVVREILKTTEQVIGIKDTIADLDHIRALLELKKEFDYFHVFAAFENQMLAALTFGVDGFINATANFAPEITVKLYNAYNKENNFNQAEDLYKKACSLMEFYKVSQPLFLACKEVVYQTIFTEQLFGERVPSIALTEKQKSSITELIKKLNLGEI
ncbi:dihydrodipicolinate synthase family protein [Halanaerobium salsuginis]|jgi:4-hydroxy-tetrahydrodipicolinate synthase|uniref:4-hydroxy-tetrahydrodipicolinate synthase n=1 Tax=Halanaerobium salsuginis TaxID=29563 RepID=A0A1I4K5Q4_9FIRM|nr:dihydrodipicolinate synthase family protein [Halanaerobium salsuginis]SFL74115.1 4-hydroxy-tetrahydrodipicolinate synthase [Halanaerobium salsuginis]